MTIDELLRLPIASVADAIACHAETRPQATALVLKDQRMSMAELNERMDRVAASLQRDGIGAGSTIAICAQTSLDYVVVYLGAIRAGVAVAPLVTSAAPETLTAMIADANTKLLFQDESTAERLASVASSISARRLTLGGEFEQWLVPQGTRPRAVDVQPDWPFNIIYSSGTTGSPKGIVQPHSFRWNAVKNAVTRGFGADTVMLATTPLYSNLTLSSFFPTLALGGRIVLLEKFDALTFLEVASRERATYAIMVPVQYQRILAHPAFGRYDLTSFDKKYCAGAPCPRELKREILERWPGPFFDVYGMTEGGGGCILAAHNRPDKLHTVGQPMLGSEILIVGEDGQPVPQGQSGEVVGRSDNMMLGYHGQPEKTREAEWFSPDGKRYLRTGDVGYFDADGFLVLIDRKKDMIISGGFNVYPSDLESVLRTHPDISEAAVVGVPSSQWGETPVGFVVPRPGCSMEAAQLREWANSKLGKTQRLADLRIVDELPRSAVGKILKRELRDQYQALPPSA